MRLTYERPRTRWLILCGTWLLVAALAAWHTRTVHNYVAMLGAMGRRAVDVSTPLQRICPTSDADAQTWMRYALALQEGAPWQVRHTDHDNAPVGREVHWHSLLAHALATAGRLEHVRAGDPLALATERALAWFNLPLFLGVVVLFSAWIAQRAGAGAGVLAALGMIGYDDFYAGFVPNYVDHHGLLTAAGFGVVIGVAFMGAGWRQESGPAGAVFLPPSRAAARRAAIISALCGAFGMWVSAASAIPAIAFAGSAGLATTWWFGPAAQRADAEFDAEVWRVWGRVGAAASFAAYLVEYFPGHLGWRLEVNHPLYALAWWGGGELIATLGAWRLAAATGRKPIARTCLFPVLAIAAAPLAISLGGASVFVLLDPFLARLHAGIAQFVSLPRFINAVGWGVVARTLIFSGCLLALGGGWLWQERSAARLVPGFAAMATAAFVALACWEIRWWVDASAPVLCLLLVLTTVLLYGRRQYLAWVAVIVIGGGLFLPPAIARVQAMRVRVRLRTPDPLDSLQVVYRDAAAALRATQPAGDIVLLASPDASTGIGYYGRFKTIGTFYWENAEGLKAAAAIFSAWSDNEAQALLKARGITHLALITESSFLAEYFALVHPRSPPADLAKTFGHRLLVQQQIPLWLRPLPYAPPFDVAAASQRVLLLQVVPDQSPAEALWHAALAELARGKTDDALRNITTAAARLPPTEQPALRWKAGNIFYQHGLHAAAARLYRDALASSDNPVLATNLAWLLATSPDSYVRNGTEALTLAQRVVQAHPDDAAFLNTLAAALAETGRYSDAVTAAERALALVRKTGDHTAESQLTQRLAAYRAGRPWRQ